VLDVESSQTTFIQFNLASIPAAYTSADITKATLKLYVNAVTTAGSFNVDYVNGTWTEGTIDASNAPALGTTIAASVPLVMADKNQYILVDVTAAVQAWLSGTPNDGIALVANSPLNASFDSKESTTTSHSPELDIVFAGGGGITGITTASGSGLTGGGTSGTLNLSLTNTCAANQILQWSGTAWACSSAGTGTITGVTHGTYLTGGGTSGNVTLDLNTSLVPLLAANNTFTGNQTITGNLSVSGSMTLPAKYATSSCQIDQDGSGAGGIITTNDARWAECINKKGATITITSVNCVALGGTGATIAIANSASQAVIAAQAVGTTLTSLTLTGTPTLTVGEWINTTLVGDGATTNIHCAIAGTY
jgi:hypothetical protein